MYSGRPSLGWNECWPLAMQVWFTQLVSNRLSLFWGCEGAQVEQMETSVLLAGEALICLSQLRPLKCNCLLQPHAYAHAAFWLYSGIVHAISHLGQTVGLP